MSIFATLSTSFAGTQAVPPDDEIRKVLAERVGENEKDVGIVVGVIESQSGSDGRRIISYGHRNAGDARPLDGDTVFEIASVTKVFTALLLADMVEKKEVALSDPASKYLPAAIKLRDRTAFDHASRSCHAHFRSAVHAGGCAALQRSRRGEILYRRSQALPCELPIDPRHRLEWHYSNIGYWVLSEALAARAGKDIKNVIRHARSFR